MVYGRSVERQTYNNRRDTACCLRHSVERQTYNHRRDTAFRLRHSVERQTYDHRRDTANEPNEGRRLDAAEPERPASRGDKYPRATEQREGKAERKKPHHRERHKGGGDSRVRATPRKGEPPVERAQLTADCRSTRDERTKAPKPRRSPPKAPQPRRSKANTEARTQPRRRQTKRAAATKRKPKGETLARHAPIMTQQEPDVRLLGFIRHKFKTLKPILFRCGCVLLRWCIRLATQLYSVGVDL